MPAIEPLVATIPGARTRLLLNQSPLKAKARGIHQRRAMTSQGPRGQIQSIVGCFQFVSVFVSLRQALRCNSLSQKLKTTKLPTMMMLLTAT